MSDKNGVMMQFFHWYNAPDGTFWDEAAARAPSLAKLGVTSLWLPPAYKGAAGGFDVGYSVYDMYDLGEFNQRGSIRTKYGTRAQYLTAVERIQDAGLQVYADTVLNHRMGADAVERVRATPFQKDDRRQATGPQREIGAHTGFTFPGRAGKYSTFAWGHRHFDAVDRDDLHMDETNTVYLLDGKHFDSEVALEKGNFSYLMGADIDFESAEVRNEITAWGKWYLDTTGADGFRLDAVKHISAWFFPHWLDEMEKHAGRDLFVVGEYWEPNCDGLLWYLERLGGRASVFDVPLHYHFHRASNESGNYDLRRLLSDTITASRSTQSVTFVDNHDSQPLQALDSPVAGWFKPLAYAFILLRREGYPCIFYPDYYGAEYEDYGRDGNKYPITLTSHRWLLDKFLRVRRDFAWGPQIDYFDHWNRVGWTRLGDADHPKALAVLMSDGPEGTKWMDVGKKNTRFVDVTEHVRDPVVTNADGWGEFRCKGGSVSVWVQAD